ncbi:hypothetical protein Tfu_3057 [Thermobifida fusca YX]|uniref:Uncharacterized protein n=1 Tax=Thermobifida fusca (strain YX) TaxID=269800 RepID=Q47KD2_THEFY|nr:hypothetical protein Tfu_3057 [Thermobifida fusca YX]
MGAAAAALSCCRKGDGIARRRGVLRARHAGLCPAGGRVRGCRLGVAAIFCSGLPTVGRACRRPAVSPGGGRAAAVADKSLVCPSTRRNADEIHITVRFRPYGRLGWESRKTWLGVRTSIRPSRTAGGIPPRARGFPGKPNRASRTWWYSGTASRADQPRTSTTRRRVGSLPRESRAAGGPSEN